MQKMSLPQTASKICSRSLRPRHGKKVSQDVYMSSPLAPARDARLPPLTFKVVKASANLVRICM